MNFRYIHYCAWCRSLRIAPADFVIWLGMSETIPELHIIGWVA